MRSTMMDVPLTVSAIMRYGTTIFPDATVTTCTAEGSRSRSYAAAGCRAAQLANALRRLGVDGDQRVATFMWNNAEHLEAYLARAVDGRGAAHAEHPPARGPAGLHRQPRRRPCDHR